MLYWSCNVAGMSMAHIYLSSEYFLGRQARIQLEIPQLPLLKVYPTALSIL